VEGVQLIDLAPAGRDQVVVRPRVHVPVDDLAQVLVAERAQRRLLATLGYLLVDRRLGTLQEVYTDVVGVTIASGTPAVVKPERRREAERSLAELPSSRSVVPACHGDAG